MKRRLFLFVLACVSAATLLPVAMTPSRVNGQTAAPSLIINQLDATNYPTLRAVVTVLDARGIPVPGLVPSQFQVFDGGTQLAVAEVLPATDEAVRANVVLVMDVSGSMEGEPLATSKAAAIEFVRALAPGDRAALITFSGEVTPLVPLTEDKDELAAAIDSLQAAGDTSLFEAVQVSAFIASSAARGGNRAAVVLLSDGENDTSTSQATTETSLGAAMGAGVPVYSIAFGSLTDRAYLQSLSDSTSGLFREATAGSISDVYAELSLLLRSQYVLTVEAEAPPDGADGTLQVIAFPGGTSATANGPFVRGLAAIPQPGETGGGENPPGGATAAEDGGGGISTLLLLAAAAIAAVAVVGGGVFTGRRFVLNRREVAHQMAVVEPNQRLAEAQGVPRRVGVMAPASDLPTAAPAETGTGRLVEHGGQSRIVEIGAGPLVLGTSPKRCQVVLTDHGAIAPEHTRIWLRGNRYVLHHVGGMSRKTLVGGQPADWVVLDSGDEITIGAYRFVFEDSVDS